LVDSKFVIAFVIDYGMLLLIYIGQGYYT